MANDMEALARALLGSVQGQAAGETLGRLAAFMRTPDGQKLTTLLAVCFSVIVVIIGILSWSSPVSLLFIVAMVLNTVALSIPDPNMVRVFIMISAPFACAYDVLNHSIGGTVNEVVSFLSAMTAYIRYRHNE